MTTVCVSMSAIRSFQPSAFRGVSYDGMVGDQYVTIRKSPTGGLVPSVGSQFSTSYGIAQVVSHWSEQCIMEIVEYDDDFNHTFTQNGKVVTQTAPEYVMELALAANRTRDCKVETLMRVLTTPSGSPTKECIARIEGIPELTEDQFVQSFGSGFKFDDDIEVLCDVVNIQRETPNRRRRSPLELEAAMRLRQDLIDECPDDIAAELDEEFGGDDLDDTDDIVETESFNLDD